MGIIEFSLKRRVTVAMAAVAVMMFGAVAFTRLPMNLLPDISYPSLTIESRFAGAAPAEVEARLRLAVSRTAPEAAGPASDPEEIHAGDLHIDEASYAAQLRGRRFAVDHLDLEDEIEQ